MSTSKTERLFELARAGPFNIKEAAEYIYGHDTKAARAATRMLLVRLRKRNTAVRVYKEILYELPDLNPQPRKNTSSRDRK